jgi:hypothetical protein
LITAASIATPSVDVNEVGVNRPEIVDAWSVLLALDPR